MSATLHDRAEQPSSDDVALSQLMNADQTTLIDLIDHLRGMGIDKDVKLPQIIVCGDQSSGKSSVLEAISRLSFPRGANLCTTFATEVALRRCTDSSGTTLSVTIQPAPSRSKEAKERLRNFSPPSSTIEDFASTINAAKELLASERSESTGPESFLEDVLRVEYSHPNGPQLTLVDLPGLIQTHDPTTQVPEDPLRVRKLVRRYMKAPGSIILAVVSAENDAILQAIFTHIGNIDPNGVRTLGIITKPDRALGRTGRYLEYASNTRHPLRLGWHVLKNRGPDQSSSLDNRDESEKAFFETDDNWGPGKNGLDGEQLGIVELRKRLSNILLDEIRLALPEIVPSIRTNITDCDLRLEKLGDARVTPLQQKVHLDKVSRQFQQILSQAVKGQYSDRQFFRPNAPSGDPRRLRASLQNLNDQFATKMFEKGHRRDFVVGPSGLLTSLQQGHSHESIFDKPVINDPEKVTRAAYLSIVRDLMRMNRGTELPGAVDHRLVTELFCDQSEKWFQIAEEHLEHAFSLVEENLKETIHYATDDQTANKIYLHWIEPKMDKKKNKLMKRLKQLIAPYQEGHPITYNHQYLETVANIRRRNEEALSKGRLQPDLVSSSLDMAASDLLDSMEAFYAVAVRTFVDNVAVLAVEMTLVSKLDEIFTPSNVTFMEPETLHLLASELEVNQRKRVELTDRKMDLQKALNVCRSYVTQVPSVFKPKDIPESPGTPGLVPANQYSNCPSSSSSSAPRTPDSAPRRRFDLGGSPGKVSMNARKAAGGQEFLNPEGHVEIEGAGNGEL